MLVKIQRLKLNAHNAIICGPFLFLLSERKYNKTVLHATENRKYRFYKSKIRL